MVPFQSTRPVKGATSGLDRRGGGVAVSIHAPREGRDQSAMSPIVLNPVSIHAPREGRDHRRTLAGENVCVFQSTRPVKGATWRTASVGLQHDGFNPRAP